MQTDVDGRLHVVQRVLAARDCSVEAALGGGVPACGAPVGQRVGVDVGCEGDHGVGERTWPQEGAARGDVRQNLFSVETW